MPQRFPGAMAALSPPGAVPPIDLIDDWLKRYQASPLRVPRKVDLRTLVGPAHGITGALALAFTDQDCAPGSAALREAEKLVAFAGGNLGMAGASAFDVCAFVNALRDALLRRVQDPAEGQALARLFDWMAALALEAYSSSRLDALRLRHRDSLEKGTPVVMVTRELPATLLVGEPERAVLEGVFGRLLLAVVRTGARALVIDGGGLVSATAPDVIEALRGFGGHKRVAALTTVISGLPPAAEPIWLEAFPAGTALTEERFDDAVARALQVMREKGP